MFVSCSAVNIAQGLLTHRLLGFSRVPQSRVGPEQNTGVPDACTGDFGELTEGVGDSGREAVVMDFSAKPTIFWISSSRPEQALGATEGDSPRGTLYKTETLALGGVRNERPRVNLGGGQRFVVIGGLKSDLQV